MEDAIAPIPPNVSKIRELISTLELCHHKADRWVYNIIEAIGVGQTEKGLGTRSPGRRHPAEQVWQDACAVLSAWYEGSPDERSEVMDYFKVQADDGGTYIIRYNRLFDSWAVLVR